MAADTQFAIDPTEHLLAVMLQRNRAMDQSAQWEAIARTTQEKVEKLTAELLELAGQLDALTAPAPDPA